MLEIELRFYQAIVGLTFDQAACTIQRRELLQE